MNKKEAKFTIFDILRHANDRENGQYEGKSIRNALDILFPDEPEEKPKRWRANREEKYYWLTTKGTVLESTEHRYGSDEELCNSDNYFQTKEEAQIYADKFKELLASREV